MPGENPSIKNPTVYEALRRKGMSKESAARISNAQLHKDATAMPSVVAVRALAKAAKGKKALTAYNAGDTRGVLDATSEAQSAKDGSTAKFEKFSAFNVDTTNIDEHLVYGIASTNTPDRQGGVWMGEKYDGDVIDERAINDAIDEYMEWANIREMHGERAAGVALDVSSIDGAVYIIAKIGDNPAWQKIQAGIYKGFSIGGRVVDAVLERLPDGRRIRRIVKMLLTEISLVDRPANPEAAILIAKRDDMPPVKEKNETTTTSTDLERLSEIANADGNDVVEKAGGDPTKVVQLIQALRDEAELAGDLETASRYSDAILLMVGGQDAEEEAEGDVEPMPVEGETPGVTEPIAMAAGAPLQKVGRKISSARMALMKRAFMDYAKMLAEAGDEDVIKMLAAATKPVDDPGSTLKAMMGELKKMVAPIASTLLAVHDDVALIKNQPISGGPVVRAAGQPITKRLDGQTPTAPARNDARIAELKRLAIVETNPLRKTQYELELGELAKLAG